MSQSQVESALKKIAIHSGVAAGVTVGANLLGSFLKNNISWLRDNLQEDGVAAAEETGHLLADMYLLFEIGEIYAIDHDTAQQDLLDNGILYATSSGLMVSGFALHIVTHELPVPPVVQSALKIGGRVAASAAAALLWTLYCEQRYGR